MSNGPTEASFIASLTAAVGDRVPAMSEAEVRQTATALAAITGFAEPVENAVQQALISIVTRMGAGVSIVNVAAGHDDDWVRKRALPQLYSDAYSQYLRQAGWSGQMVESLSDVSLRILGHLQDPISEGSWKRRGLVIGHVQSGKTANYLGVACRAADAGYKFIIVIAGIHNNLRQQTQHRVDEGFIGRSSDPSQNRKVVGVGSFSADFPHPVTLTTIHDDFTARTAKSSGWQINDFSKPLVFVIKKNVTTLKALHKWLFALNAKNGHISDVPMLMIDDEADNASINTNKPDLDPTKTNALIRQVLGLFDKSCYIGYTATPFANIFINPDAYGEGVYEELFPNDFIYSLDPPTSYFGPEKVFLDEESSERALVEIEDFEDVLPTPHQKDSAFPYLPESLIRAIDLFLVARAIRIDRGQRHMHCSMMVNVTRFVDVQRAVKLEIGSHLKRVQDAVLANYALPGAESDGNSHLARLRAALEGEYSSAGTTWERVKELLPEVVQSARLFVVNSKTDDALDYARYGADGEGLTAIAIGGLSLSRGLTIEGLTISYMHRNTSMYDTLMQMGRWFGYRPRYEDLCRVFLPGQSIDWYGHIAEKTEELRSQIRRMRREGKSPRDFGLYVESHPDTLLITAANKMRHGIPMEFQRSFGGQLVETHIVPMDAKVNSANEELIAEYWRRGFGGKLREGEKGWIVEDAPVSEIVGFLARFRAYPGVSEIEIRSAIDYLQEIATAHPFGDVLLISVGGKEGVRREFELNPQLRASAKLIEEDRALRMSKDRVASRGDEGIGLTKSQLADARGFALRDHEADPKRSDKPSDAHFREARKKPLLMVHVLAAGPEAKRAERAPAVGISFPFGRWVETIPVVVNKVWVDQMLGSGEDDPDAEEDYDE